MLHCFCDEKILWAHMNQMTPCMGVYRMRTVTYRREITQNLQIQKYLFSNMSLNQPYTEV